jgi:hypothetical protein
MKAADPSELAGVAGQDVQAQRGQRKDQERDQDGREPVFAGQQRHAHEGEHQSSVKMMRSWRIGKIWLSAM